MAGTVNITKCMDAIKTAVVAVTAIGSSRCLQGKEHLADSTNRDNEVRALTNEAQGYFAFALASVQTGKPTENGFMNVIGRLFVPVNKDTSSDLNTAYEVMNAVRLALFKQSNYEAVGCVPEGGEMVEVQDGKDGIYEWDVTAKYRISPVC